MIAEAGRLRLPRPAVTSGWPSLTAVDTPSRWARGFVRGLLDIDFARASRSSLGSWLVAEDAPDLMPGVPASFAARALYVSALDPTILGATSPIPSPSSWKFDARSRVRWSVHDLLVELDPQWQQMIDTGWQPRDLRATVEDVSGVLSVTRGATTTSRRISLVLQLGSATWHEGYGTVLVEEG